MGQKQVVKKLIGLFLIISSLSAILFYIQEKIGLEQIREIIVKAGFWGPSIYIILQLLTHIVAPIQGSPFMFLAIAIFGKWAIIYTYIAGLLSGITNFWIARKLGRSLVVKLVGKDGITKIDSLAEKQGIKALIILRFFQGFITDFVSYAAGLTLMKFSTYYLISVLVPLPWTIGMFLFFNIVPPQQVFLWTLIFGAALFVTPPIYYFLKKKIFLQIQKSIP